MMHGIDCSFWDYGLIVVARFACYEESSRSFVSTLILDYYSFVGLHRSAFLRWITASFVVSFRRSSVISLASLRQLSQSLSVDISLRR